MFIIKRDGSKEEFNEEKIINALKKVFKTDELPELVMEDLPYAIESICSVENPTVEFIQDEVENFLMGLGFYQEAKDYIIYRYEHSILRKNKTALAESIAKKLEATNVANQNANVDEYSFGGRIGEAGRIVTKEYALENCMSPMARKNHENNEIYIHDLDSYAVGMHNCTVRSTKFITDKGVFSFEDFKDGDIIKVLTHTGNFEAATVKSYGIKDINNITFSRAGQRFVSEKFTPDHRWILDTGEITQNLKIGDKIIKAPVIREFNFDEATKKEQYYWCLGFVLADGTEAYRWSHGKKQENIKFVRMRLCGKKIQYESRFSGLKHSTKEMKNGDLYLTFSSTIGFRKIFPDISNMTWREKLALFDGLYCADGQYAGNRKSILTTSEQIASFIEDIVPSLGYYIIGINDKTDEQTNYKKRGFTKEYIFIGDTNKYYWTVTDIKPSIPEVTWCLEVNKDHSFVLPNGIVTGNCLSVPFDKLLANGFKTRQVDIRPANSINTAFQLVAVIFQIQSLQQFGGVSATHLDWTMVPYVRKSFYKHYTVGLKYFGNTHELHVNDPGNTSIEDKFYKALPDVYEYAVDMTKREIMQAVEGMYHNLNSLQSRSGCQLPFTSLNYGTCTLPEGRWVIEALLSGSIKGVGFHNNTPIFPCGIFQYSKEINGLPGTPNYDLYQLALKSTAKRLYPNYANVDWSGNAGYDKNDPKTLFSSMGCRTANSLDINGLGQLKDGRGNICPVTIILPTLAMEANKDVESFMSLLDTKIAEAKDMLIERFEWICSQNPKSASFMWENGTMEGYIPEEGIRSALKHGTLAVGQLGLAETLQLLIGKDHTTEEGMKLAKRIESLFKQRCSEFKQTYKLNFGVYFTPAENLSYTALKKFKAKYGEIPNVSDKEFFTNSMHIPVWHQITPFEKIDLESQLTGYSSAGCITYVELDSSVKHNIEGLETIVNYAMDHDIPYFAINIPNDQCMNCGYIGDINNECPSCSSTNIKRLRRVTGYLSTDYRNFNLGKQDEVEHRVKHIKEVE